MLSYTLERRNTAVNDKTDDDLTLLSIRFDGSMDARESAPESLKGKLFLAEAGDVVFSKIDIRNGAIGIVPHQFKRAAFTSEFPIYKVRESVSCPEYIQLLFRSEIFRATINGMVSGASGRKRVSPEQLENTKVPIPDVKTQKAVVTLWQKATTDANQAEAEAVKLEIDAQSALLDALGLHAPPKKNPRRAFSLPRSKIERWGVSLCWQGTQAVATPKYPVRPIRSLCRLGSGGTPSRAVQSYFKDGTIPWVKTTEVNGEVITKTEEHITSDGLKNSSAKLYPAGSLIVAMYGQGATRGRSAKLGIEAATNQACCVLHGFSSEVDPDFLWHFLMADYDRLRAQASGNNQPNLNAEMIASYSVPVPPLADQKQLLEAIKTARSSAQEKRSLAQCLRATAKAKLEAALLGQSLPEISSQ